MFLKIGFIIATIGFLGIPGLIYQGSDVQPSTLLFGWLLIASQVRLKFNRDFIFLSLLFLVYIILVALYLQVDLDWKTLLIYCIGLIQLCLYSSLFTSLSQKPINFLLEKFLCLIPILVFFSIICTFNFPDLLLPFKSRTIMFDGLESYRGASGILPEPGAVGFFCGAIILASFLLNISNAIKLINPLLPISLNKMLCITLIPDYLSKNYVKFSLASGLFSALVSFSVTSFISYILLVSVIFFPFFLNLSSSRISIKPVLIASFFTVLLSLLLIFNPFPQSSRGYSVLTALRNDPLLLLSGNTGDASAGDRGNSTKIGLTSPMLSPFGNGLNGISNLTSNCNSSMVISLQLQCENDYNSSRNHNSLANFTQDGGLLGLLFLISLLSPGFNPICLSKYSFPVISIIFYLVLALIALPAPLGSPAVWILIASLRHFALTCYSFRCDIN